MKPKFVAQLLLGTALLLGAAGGARADDKTIKIGVLTDNSGLYATSAAPARR
jgi:branched-chain amino acid transport system substrate-binding protein